MTGLSGRLGVLAAAALLVRRPEDRLGSGPLGTMELRRHPFFSAHGIDDWARLEARQLPSPLLAAVRGGRQSGSAGAEAAAHSRRPPIHCIQRSRPTTT